MMLLIDAGNTRVKWGLRRDGSWHAQGAITHADIPTLADVIGSAPLAAVMGVNVAGLAIAGAIETTLSPSGRRPEWIMPSVQRCGVRNLYDNPEQLGADRWAALIGARALHPGACLVVTSGTATTIDHLDEDGVFQGGLILPGTELMRRSLAGNTAQLPFADGRFTPHPRNTADAIISGCLAAQVGAVERMYRGIQAGRDPMCLLNGGGAGMLETVLAIPYRRIDNLVLEGLAVIAATHPLLSD